MQRTLINRCSNFFEFANHHISYFNKYRDKISTILLNNQNKCVFFTKI